MSTPSVDPNKPNAILPIPSHISNLLRNAYGEADIVYLDGAAQRVKGTIKLIDEAHKAAGWLASRLNNLDVLALVEALEAADDTDMGADNIKVRRALANVKDVFQYDLKALAEGIAEANA